MSKKRKKKWYEEEQKIEPKTPTNPQQGLFSNTERQHKAKYGKDIDWDAYDDVVASPYKFDWGLERRLDTRNGDALSRKEQNRNEFHNTYNNYQSTGGWRGYEYYKPQQLSYKYIQQMANILSAKYKITVTVSNEWRVDLKKKTLTYNPASLIYGTKSELLATLLHEIGKLRYCDHPYDLKDKYVAVYKVPAVEVLTLFEDVRADYAMLKEYGGAAEIYDSAIPMIDKKVGEYRQMGAMLSQLIPDILEKTLHDLVERATANAANVSPQTGYSGNGAATSPNNSQAEKFIQDSIYNIFGERDIDVVKQKLADIRQEYKDNGNLYDYAGQILHVMYDTDAKDTAYENILEKIDKTEPAVEKVKKLFKSQDVVDEMSQSVYPVIEDLLRDFNKDNERIKSAFPNMNTVVQEHLANELQQAMQGMNEGRVNTTKDGNTNIRTSAPTKDVIPQEWQSGDYVPLKESVMPEIKSLVRLLTFIRREDMTKRYQGNERRGKLNSKHLYRAATGNNRVFKRMLPNSNLVQSFAFSILVDTSGSMEGSRMVHTTRGLVILSEVFKQMDIPFEIITFASAGQTLKKFDQSFDSAAQKRIGGLPGHANGGTNLHEGLGAMKLELQPEANKVCIVLSDGGVGDAKHFDNQFFEPMAKKGIKSVAFGIECGNDVAKLCMGNSRAIDSANKLPIEFANLIKSLIKRK